MTGPKLTNVDLSALRDCNPDKLAGLSREKLAEAIKGTDLKVDPESGQVIGSGKARRIWDVALQAEQVRHLTRAAGEDYNLSLEEAAAFIESEEKFRGFTAQGFLADAKKYVESRWQTICNNLKEYSIEYPLQNLVNHLEAYNDGVYKAEFDDARYSFSPLKSTLNALGWAANLISFGSVNRAQGPIKRWDHDLGRETEIEGTWLAGDNVSMQDAYDDHLDRQVAIAALVKVLNKDIEEKGEKGLAWKALGNAQDPQAKKTSAEEVLQALASAGEIQVVVERPDATVDAKKPEMRKYERTLSGEEAAEILRNQLAFEDLFALNTNTDKKARGEKAMAMIHGERPGFMGLGGGHAEHWDWDNMVTPGVNNLHYARSLATMLMREGSPEQIEQAKKVLYQELMPSGENTQTGERSGALLSDKFLYYGTGTLVFPNRVMSDEEAMYTPERLIKGGLIFAGTYKWGPEAINGIGKIKPWVDGHYKVMRSGEKSYHWLKKGALYPAKGATWTIDKALGIGTARPLRRKFMNWLTKGTETSEQMQKGAKLGKFGRSLMGLAAAYVVDDYLSPLVPAHVSGPAMDSSTYNLMLTTDPVPPHARDEVLEAAKQGATEK